MRKDFEQVEQRVNYDPLVMFKVVGWTLLISFIVFVGLVVFIYWLARDADPDTLHWLTAFFAALSLVAVVVGFPTMTWIGRNIGLERGKGVIHGVTHGTATAYEHIGGVAAAAVRMQQSIKNTYNQADQPPLPLFDGETRRQMQELAAAKFLPPANPVPNTGARPAQQSNEEQSSSNLIDF